MPRTRHHLQLIQKHKKDQDTKSKLGISPICKQTSNLQIIDNPLNWQNIINRYIKHRNKARSVQNRPNIQDMTQLWIVSCCLKDTDIQALSQYDKYLRKLKYLYLQYNDICKKGVFIIFGLQLPELKLICLDNNNIQNNGCEVLLKNVQRLTNIQSLFINNNNISSQGLLQLPSVQLCNLKILSLSFNLILTKGIQLVVKSSLPLLEQLCLNSCGLNNQSLKSLTKGKWPNLKVLQLLNNDFNYEGYVQITKLSAANLRRLLLAVHKSKQMEKESLNEVTEIYFIAASSWPLQIYINFDQLKRRMRQWSWNRHNKWSSQLNSLHNQRFWRQNSHIDI